MHRELAELFTGSGLTHVAIRHAKPALLATGGKYLLIHRLTHASR